MGYLESRAFGPNTILSERLHTVRLIFKEKVATDALIDALSKSFGISIQEAVLVRPRLSSSGLRMCDGGPLRSYVTCVLQVLAKL